MVDRDYIEKALLLGVVKQGNWLVMIHNNMDIKYFSFANRNLYKYIKEEMDNKRCPELKTLAYRFDIDDIALQGYLDFDNLDEACRVLIDSYKVTFLNNKTAELNEYQYEMNQDPDKYIERLGALYDEAKFMCHHVTPVDVFEDIDKQLGQDKESISTGFRELDDKLKGWQRGEELIVFMGRTGQGKSWLGLKFAMTAALAGEKVGIYSGEMSKEQLQERLICCAKEHYDTTKEDAVKFIHEHNMYIKTLTQRELRKRASVNDMEKFIVNCELTMLIVDQLSLMEDSTSKAGTPLRQQYGNISMDLFMLSSKYNLPVILLVQSNRQGGENKDGPALENIAESDAVAQNATRVISMKKEGSVLTLNILKNRYGDGNLIQRYEVDYGKNKYRAIQEVNQPSSMRKGSRSMDSMFRSNRTF